MLPFHGKCFRTAVIESLLCMQPINLQQYILVFQQLLLPAIDTIQCKHNQHSRL